MKFYIKVLILFFLGSPFSFSESPSKLIKLLGFEESLRSQVDQANVYISASLRETHLEFVASLENPSEEYLEKIEVIYRDMQASVGNLIDLEKYTKVWGHEIAKDLSEQEILEVVKFYSSPVGKRFVVSNNRASALFSQQMFNDTTSQFEAVWERYLEAMNDLEE